MTESQQKFLIQQATAERDRLRTNADHVESRPGNPGEREADRQMAADARERADAWHALVQDLTARTP